MAIIFPCGQSMKNPFMLAPLTNTQSNEDGTLSNEELHWLTMRAKGGFGMVMTCASHVQINGKGFPGQLGIFDDKHIEGHTRLTKAIQQYDSLAIIQIFHAGMRSPHDLIEGVSVSASAVERKGTRALTIEEVERLRDDFIAAALRAKKCGYNGVEIHGAHGYILCQFLSSTINQRTDKYGGSLSNRSRLIFEIIDGIRATCGKEFILGIRLSPERFGMQLHEIKTLCEQLVETEKIDFIDLSLWDCFKYPEDATLQDKTLLEHFTSIDYKKTILSMAGKIRTGKDVSAVLNAKVDVVSIGTAGILHHDFPSQIRQNLNFQSISLPVSQKHLHAEGVGEKFIQYLMKRDGFVRA